MGFGTIIVIFLVACVAIAIVSLVMQARARDAMTASMADAGFQATHQFMSSDARTGIGVNDFARQVALTTPNYAPTVVPFRDLLEVEILEDGNTVTKTNRSSQAGRALLGGLAFGGIGMLAGALTAKKKSIVKVTRVDLQIVVNSIAKPIHILNFLDHEVEKDSAQFKSALAKAQHWYGVVSACIQMADEDDARAQAQVAQHQSVTAKEERLAVGRASVAEELAKLAELRDRGVLSDSEFAELKADLLAKSGEPSG